MCAVVVAEANYDVSRVAATTTRLDFTRNPRVAHKVSRGFLFSSGRRPSNHGVAAILYAPHGSQPASGELPDGGVPAAWARVAPAQREDRTQQGSTGTGDDHRPAAPSSSHRGDAGTATGVLRKVDAPPAAHGRCAQGATEREAAPR